MSGITQENAFIFRITHMDNVPWMLRNGIHCRNSPNRDPTRMVFLMTVVPSSAVAEVVRLRELERTLRTLTSSATADTFNLQTWKY